MRVFIGIEFSDEVKDYLQKIAQIIKKNTIKGDFTRFDNYHLTLKYIGRVTDDEVYMLEDIISDISDNISSFNIKLGEIGSFDRKHSSIIYLGIKEGLSELNTLFKLVEKMTIEEDFEPENRKYRPHITLGKKVVFNKYNTTELLPIFNQEISVKKITLFESHRVNDILTYTPIFKKELYRW